MRTKRDRRIYGDRYELARGKAFDRSLGVCQICGRRDAEQGHHWALKYPTDAQVTPDDLTALCRPCHEIATEIRKAEKAGVSVWPIISKILKGIRACLSCLLYTSPSPRDS